MRGLLIALLFLGTMTANGQSLMGKPFLAVKGSAKAEVIPDTFPLTVTLRMTSMDVAEAQSQIETLAGQVLKLAQALEVEDRDIDLQNLSISPQSTYDDDTDARIFLGNEVERKITVAFHKLSDLQAFIKRLPAGKLVELETESFTYSKADEVKRELRKRAIATANQDAQDMASAVGKKLLALHNLSDSPQGMPYSSFGDSGARIGTVSIKAKDIGAIQPGADVILQEGVLTLSADVYLVYLIGD